MKKLSMEKRLADLERQVAALAESSRHFLRDDLNTPLVTMQPGRDEWKETLGIFGPEDGMDEVFEEALKLREADRQATRQPPPRRKPGVKPRKAVS